MLRAARTPKTWALLGAIMLAVFMGARAWLGGGVAAQAPGWPTPPPGSQFAPPSQQAQLEEVTESVQEPNTDVILIPASWPGVLPLVPPVPTTLGTFDAITNGPPVTIRVDAGTYNRSVQLRLSALDLTTVDAGPSALWGFRLEAFDFEGRTINDAPQRPIKVSIPARALTAADVPAQALLYFQEQGDERRALVTELASASGTLTTRLGTLGAVWIVNDGG